MDSWPIALQQLLNADDFDLQVGTTTVRTSMDVGPDKIRARFTDAVDLYTCSVMMDIDNYNDLIDFFKTTLNNGALPFLFNNPFTGDPEVFRFVTPPDLKPIGGRIFRVALALEKLP